MKRFGGGNRRGDGGRRFPRKSHRANEAHLDEDEEGTEEGSERDSGEESSEDDAEAFLGENNQEGSEEEFEDMPMELEDAWEEYQALMTRAKKSRAELEKDQASSSLVQTSPDLKIV